MFSYVLGQTVKDIKILILELKIIFPKKIQISMKEVEKLTEDNTGTTVIIAADYGGRWDLANAVRQLAKEVESERIVSSDIGIDVLHKYTSLYGYPDPDLCIRTGGERRISNFLLWQFAYTEFYFTDVFWPDFDEAQLRLALDDFAFRQRRYGGHEFTLKTK